MNQACSGMCAMCMLLYLSQVPVVILKTSQKLLITSTSKGKNGPSPQHWSINRFSH